MLGIIIRDTWWTAASPRIQDARHYHQGYLVDCCKSTYPGARRKTTELINNNNNRQGMERNLLTEEMVRNKLLKSLLR
ncbi:hypothetical protein DPMN_186533 [Dreissena polymorpha]|uniref:Uncharacterized protein n=1 Tax=Dreissena polymorpha TaxID=45954 RepID=A0A9D4DMD0_DREPO|nr:hypothetical protein DPMN_186533 [Dreissena polymorpha]